MKMVEVFTINRNTKMLPAASCYYDFPPSLASGVMHDASFERKTVPVERICNNLQNRDGTVSRTERYIVVEPELRELLTVKERQEIDELHAKVRHLNKVIQTQQHEVSSWWAQPWYVRAWLSIRGEKL
jgi:hypothetical protein